MAATAIPDTRLALSDTQHRFVHDEHQYALFLGGIGAGKTFAGAVKPMVQQFGRHAQPSLGIVVAPTYPMLRDATWRTAVDVWRPLIDSIVRNEMRVVLKTGDQVIFRSADDPERLRGPNASWAWIDEAALCHPDTWPIIIGRLREGGRSGPCFMSTTPKGMNWVYDVFVTRANADTVIYRAATWANPFLSARFVEVISEQYQGEFAKQELDAEFIADTVGAVYPWRWLEEARLREAPQSSDAAISAGIDVAGPGEDETVVYLRRGGHILGCHAFGQSDPRGEVIALLREYVPRGLAYVGVDAAGIGWYFAQDVMRALDAYGVEVRRVNVAEASDVLDHVGNPRFANLKAELYWSLRTALEDGRISGLNDQTTIAQLAGVLHSYDRKNRIAIESKDDARKRGIKSPDRAEALVLSFAPPSQADRVAQAFAQTAVPDVREMSPEEARLPWNRTDDDDDQYDGGGLGIWSVGRK